MSTLIRTKYEVLLAIAQQLFQDDPHKLEELCEEIGIDYDSLVNKIILAKD